MLAWLTNGVDQEDGHQDDPWSCEFHDDQELLVLVYWWRTPFFGDPAHVLTSIYRVF